jgi:hypothetical protein
MARPQKQGLDYFPLDVDIDQDDKVTLIEAEHGIVGFGVIIKILMKVYKEGYYYEWGKKQQLLFANRVNVDINQVIAIINSCLEWGLFDKRIYEEYGILTSTGIQRRFLEAVKRRKEVTVINEYWLLDQEERPNIVNVNINRINVCNNSQVAEVNDDNNPQSKVKKSKVYIIEQKEPIEKLSPFTSKKQKEQFATFWNSYPKKKSKGQAEKTWVKIAPDDDLFLEIMAGLERAKKSKDWTKDDGQYIPYPSTWLNAKGWEDEHVPVRRTHNELGDPIPGAGIVVPY